MIGFFLLLFIVVYKMRVEVFNSNVLNFFENLFNINDLFKIFFVGLLYRVINDMIVNMMVVIVLRVIYLWFSLKNKLYMERRMVVLRIINFGIIRCYDKLNNVFIFILFYF